MCFWLKVFFCFLHIVLRFVGPADDSKSCVFIQMMEQRLENVFAEAQEKVEDSYGTLSVEVFFQLNLKTKFDEWLNFRGLITPSLCWIWIYSFFVFSDRF